MIEEEDISIAEIKEEKDINDIDPSDLISKYRQDHFKMMPTVNHDFLFSASHPLKRDHVLVLENN